ncbi:MAG TPA: FlgD immunoglobulin-like domain containing protein, partial [bacterium]|nr:FlgD immunoglobulin-like domain containing protein [bacterium]
YGRWVLGETPGHNKVMAYRLGLYNSPIPFTATGVTNHFPEFHGLPAYEQEIEYNRPWSFTLHALDADNDPLKYSLRIKPNPTNARFDSLGNQLFQWTPTIRQKGSYQFFFTVQDAKGGLDVDSLLVKVVGDSAPVITSLYPMCGLPLTLSKPDSMVFSCTAVDYDGDPLTYRWFVNERSFNGPNFVFRSLDHPRGSLRIHVEISDGMKTTRSCEWVMLVTQVDLTSFTAAFEPFVGVRLNWRAASEVNNAGFDVLRSTSEQGGFSLITRKLIAATGAGSYEFVDSTAVAGVRYFYQLQDLSLDGSRTLHGPVQVDLALPERFNVLQNYPNPFNPETRIRFQLPVSGRTRIEVFNTLGQLVRSLADAPLPAGYHEIDWDGRDEQGRPVGSAVYYYRVESAGERAVKKMVLLR